MKTTLFKVIASTLLTTGIAISLVAAPAQANGRKEDNSNDKKNKQEVVSPSSPVTTETTTTTNTATNAICSTDNVLLGGVKATACKNEVGNDTGNKGTLEGLLDSGAMFGDLVGTGVDWTLVGKSDGDAGNFGFFADNGENKDGDWGFKKALNTNTFVVSLKAGTAYTAYLFQDYDWNKGLTGIFDTIGVEFDGTGKAGRALSHASIFASNIKVVTPPPAEVPEPATLVGLGLALGGMLSIRRKSH